MKFLVDAQLPRRLMYRFRDAGFDALHTLDLPRGNRTPDREIIALALAENRIVVTKDYDFVDSFFVEGQPDKILLISTGNLANAKLEFILTTHLDPIVEALRTNDFVELTQKHVLIHR